MADTLLNTKKSSKKYKVRLKIPERRGEMAQLATILVNLFQSTAFGPYYTKVNVVKLALLFCSI